MPSAIRLDCPIQDCHIQAEALATHANQDDVHVAVHDAIVRHIREDHIGHAHQCPRRRDRDDYCNCHVDESRRPPRPITTRERFANRVLRSYLRSSGIRQRLLLSAFRRIRP